MGRRIQRSVVLAVTAIMISGCGGKRTAASLNEAGNMAVEQSEQEPEEIIQEFEGVIKESNGTSAVIEVAEGFAIRNSGSMVSVSLDEAAASAREGDRVRVTYSGAIMETYPLQLANQKSIDLLEKAENSESPRESSDKNQTGESAVNAFPGVTMTLLEATKTGVRVELLNTTDLEVDFGEDYDLQEYAGGEWVSVPYVIDNWSFQSIAYKMPRDKPVEWETDWKTFHGALEPGSYRLVKSVMDFRGTGDYTQYRLAVEFEITEENGKTTARLRQEPSPLRLHDALSSTYSNFEVKSGNYTWYCKTGDGDEMKGSIACGSGPLDEVGERKTLKLPHYNKLDYVPYTVFWEEMPDSMTVKEYSTADLGNAEAKEISSTTYDEIFTVDLKPGRVYEIMAEWREEKQNEKGFHGSASYVVVTE